MGLILKGLAAVILLASVYVYFQLNKAPPNIEVEEKWWGPGTPGKEDTSIKPFKINVPNEIIADLKKRLDNAVPFQPPLEGVNQNYGMNTELLKKIVEYWKTKYDWKERQDFLNKYPQFQTSIDGLKIHFIRVKPQNPGGLPVLPLLLVHGWPGSVREFYEMIPLLTTPQKGRDFVFELIIPSLPGYGFSDAAVRPGLGVVQMGALFKKLMNRLNFDKYYVQGGDWGAIITQVMSALYPKDVLAMHGNMCFTIGLRTHLTNVLGSYFPSLIYDNEIEKEQNYPFSKVFFRSLLESGYMHLQSTKPDTIGVALRESPVGLAAYILEKFTTWTNPAWKDLPDGGLTKKYTMDQLLDNVMIYWVTRSITTSMRLYSEHFTTNNVDLKAGELPITVPSGCTRFAHELVNPTKIALKGRFLNLIHLTDYPDGGHFAAFEVPEVLAKDIYDFFEKVRKLPKEKQEL